MGMGELVAQKAYTLFSYPINALYSKFRPRRPVAMALFGLLLGGVHLWMVSWSLAGRLAFPLRRMARPAARCFAALRHQHEG